MYRCIAAALAALTLSLGIAAPAAAQPQRNFPADALRGALVIGDPPLATLNGQVTRLAPGARIRGQNNLLVLSGTLSGQRLLVHYTLDTQGLLRDVWILTADEAMKKPWPTSAEEAGVWTFDPVAQAWTRP
jgi:hypothetical protein